MAQSNPQIAKILGAGDSRQLVDTFFVTVLSLQAVVASGFVLSSVLRLRGAEKAGQVELLLAIGQSRSRWATWWLLVTGVSAVAIVAAGGVGVGLAHSVATGDFSQLTRLTGAALAYLPATLLLGGLTALLFGWLPRTALAGWGILAGCFVVGWLGDLLQLPDWLIDLSPFRRVPQLPLAAVDWTPIVAMSALVLAFGALALPGLRRRDIG